MTRPILDDIELQNVQHIEVDGDQVLTQHSIPALEGDFLQRLGRRARQVTLTGVLMGPDAQADIASDLALDAKARLKRLRDKFQAATPVEFIADITTSTRIKQVLIEEMGVRELAGKPERFEYTFTLREYVPAPERPQETPRKTASLVVYVIVDNEPDFNYNTITGLSDIPGHATLTKTSSQPADNTWQATDIPPGSYTITARPEADDVNRGLNPNSAPVEVPEGGQGQVTIRLRREGSATLMVHVVVDGHPDFDFSQVAVTVSGSQQDGTPLTPQTLHHRTDNTWREENFPSGSYTVTAATEALGGMSASGEASVPEFGLEEVTITLRPGSQKVIKYLVIHFWFDKAFIEPCMRAVMREVAQRLTANPQEKLLILGHTDLVGSDDYNQFLSERRARSAYAYLTFGRDAEAAVDEWDRLRQQRPPGTARSLNDTWETREYQYMLQDLGYYRGNITEVHDEPTGGAVRNFQRDHLDDDGNPLVIDGLVGDRTWRALIRAYLAQDALSVPEGRFLANADTAAGCDGGIVKWLGTGEKDPVKNGGPCHPQLCRKDGNTEDAWRPNRRTEFLFVQESEFPSAVAEPASLQMPPPTGDEPFLSAANQRVWCLGDRNSPRRCFVRPYVAHPEATCHPTSDPWTREPVHPEELYVQGSVRFEDGRPLANAEYILLSADGEYLHIDTNGQPDLAEVRSGAQRGRPNPICNRTDENGEFSYPRKTPAGIYSLEVKGPYLIHSADAPATAAKGNVVCQRLRDDTSRFDVIVMAVPTALEFVDDTNVDREIDRVKWGEDFRLRADFPGITDDEIIIEVSSYLVRRLS